MNTRLDTPKHNYLNIKMDARLDSPEYLQRDSVLPQSPRSGSHRRHRQVAT